jgi:ABC-type lipoprotein export system ATPase subunit
MIRLDKVCRSFPATGRVLDAVCFDIERGDFVTIMGPSGAGKSTLLSVLALLDQDWEGQYWLDGQPVHLMTQKERIAQGRRHVGIVFQRFHLLEELTVAENLEVPLSYRELPAAERRARVADTLDRFGIVGKKDLLPAQLSGGQQQLVAVARAVIARPTLLLADEPTGNLHTEQGAEVMRLFVELHRLGTTIVQVTHSESIAAHSQRIVRMRDGRIESEGRCVRL